MKKIIKILVIILFCSPYTISVFAQNIDSLAFKAKSIRSAGIGFPALNYDLLSPLNHSGYSLGFTSSRFTEKKEHLNLFETYFRLGLLHNYANDSYITLLGYSASWTLFRYTTDPKKRLQIWLGASAEADINVYMKDDNTNNPVAYFFNISVTPALLIQYRFNIGSSKFEFRQNIGVPLFSLVSTSDFASSMPYGFAEEDASFFDTMHFASLGSLVKCVAITKLDINTAFQQRKNMPTFRISYRFTGLNYQHNDISIKSVDNMVVFGALFYLFR